jgi:hypothetical protein
MAKSLPQRAMTGKALRQCHGRPVRVQRVTNSVQRSIATPARPRPHLGFRRMARLLRSISQYRSPIRALGQSY